MVFRASFIRASVLTTVAAAVISSPIVLAMAYGFSFPEEAVKRGAGEVMVTSIDRDGSGSGMELRLISLLSENLIVPVIASGGCGLAQHFVEGYAAGASAVAAGTFFSQRDQNPMQCRSHIRNAGVSIRLEV